MRRSSRCLHLSGLFWRAALAAGRGALAAALLSLALAGAARAEVKAGEQARDFTLRDAAGKPVSLSSLRGKVVLIDFWAEWCAPCKKELPALDTLAKKLGARGLEIVAVNIDKKRHNADRFLKQANISALRVLYDPEGTTVGAYEPPTMPSSYLLDRTGKVHHVHTGFTAGDEAKLAARIEALLK